MKKQYNKLTRLELSKLYHSYKSCFGDGTFHQSGLYIYEWYEKYGLGENKNGTNS